MIKKYELSFDVCGLILFFLAMIPNFIWFVFPAPNDVLRVDSITQGIDMIASVCQVLLVAFLCAFKNKESEPVKMTPLILVVIGWCVLYFVSWVSYYMGITNTITILGLTIPPCLAFLFYAMDRKNGLAIIPTIIFMICHFIHATLNFIVH